MRENRPFTPDTLRRRRGRINHHAHLFEKLTTNVRAFSSDRLLASQSSYLGRVRQDGL